MSTIGDNILDKALPKCGLCGSFTKGSPIHSTARHADWCCVQRDWNKFIEAQCAALKKLSHI
ncbi:hypothetical protein OS493_013057 [Desmophyllum pertusum]|uniref:Uncharacterized protein n=1 Tax=Desmophyllum pertusum TaxID=174260 RepID=A0A9W9Z1W9_9CNID|nr:hypothetical protein OS493_013057 [Desmophyllum pertusum]